MFGTKAPLFVFRSPPFFSASWVGRHPYDHLPRLVVCFGPALPDDFAAVQAGVLGLGSVLEDGPPPHTSAHAEIDGGCLVVCSSDHELVRTQPLSDGLVNLLERRPEVLLMWVDVPLQNPREQLSTVGMEHVWTGLATVRRVSAEAAHRLAHCIW